MTTSNDHVDEFFSFLLEFVSESDRAAVVLGASMIDEQLKTLLSNTLLPSRDKQDDLLEGDRPLATFSARIRVAYRLGLISADLAQSLDIIRTLRNVFAHKIKTGSLKTVPHKDRVAELIRPLLGGKGYERLKPIIEGKMTKPHRSSVDFRVGLAVVASRLMEAIRQSQPLSRSNGVGLVPEAW
ncbi:MAG TPA: hypothetical protein VM529_07225 [Gemmata sp.]|nr:hypothetical protein [Gemmata sp.]